MNWWNLIFTLKATTNEGQDHDANAESNNKHAYVNLNSYLFIRGLATCLPKKTPESYTIIFLKLINIDVDNFNFIEQIKYLHMACMLQLYQEGTSTGHVFVADLKGVVFTHLTKVILAGPIVLKNFLQYLQEGMSIRLKGLHFINIAPFMDKILALVKPLKKMELLDVLYLHNTLDELVKFIPLECLPANYGGFTEDTSKLHERAKDKYFTNSTFFEWEDK
ncbi:hypothetical protein Zmor_021525 [Zophobas morio]|uniref:CRAL-TRIO domain-containing protein n=1 Tax=Zophobas morio TaxID=2755281 RepID=A0AA38MAK1_9CUCU|nr:hypothetical protein Zmor_021525 [Zophobas morio]